MPNNIKNVRSPADAGVNYLINGNDYAAYISDTPTGRTGFVLSVDPLIENQTSYIELGEPVAMPFEVSAEIAISNRTNGAYFNFELVNADDAVTPDYTTNAISSIQQTTTTLTISSLTQFQVDADDWINITGVIDNRLNYSNAVVASVSTDKLTITVTVANDATIPSLSVGPYVSQGTVIPINHFNSARDGLGYRFSQTSTIVAGLISRFNGASAHDFGTPGGTSLSTIATTAIIYPVAATGQSAVKPTTKFLLKADSDNVLWADRTLDSQAAYTPRATSTGVKSNYSSTYQARLRSQIPLSTPRPIAKIVSAVKTGTTTATITTASAHGLTTGNYVTLVGIRDNTNFPNLTVAATVTVVDALNFTVIIGGAVTATSYGGAVCLSNGGYTQPALISQVIQSAAVDALNNVTLIGSAAWSSGVGVMNVGDLVNLYGCRDIATGADLGLDGVYWVNTISTTTLILSPLSALPYTSLGNNVASPVNAVLSTTSAGGCIIVRPTAYVNDVSLISKSISSVMIEGQGTSDLTKAVPVNILTGSAILVSQFTRSSPGAGWLFSPDNIPVVDIASAAITTTTTSAAVSPTILGTAAEFNVIVTVVTGTSPTMDVGIEESDDSGTNWYRIYDFPRITATGAYRSPILPLSGNRLRYVQTISGTTPSFTRAINRVTHQFVSPAPYRQIIDRSLAATQALNATTASLITNGTRDLQLIMSVGTITTTAPTIQLQGSDDNGVSWYNIGSALAGGVTSNTTVSLTIVDVNSALVRAIVTVAGVSTTLNYVLIKCFG